MRGPGWFCSGIVPAIHSLCMCLTFDHLNTMSTKNTPVIVPSKFAISRQATYIAPRDVDNNLWAMGWGWTYLLGAGLM